jgi:hypothetical protein
VHKLTVGFLGSILIASGINLTTVALPCPQWTSCRRCFGTTTSQQTPFHTTPLLHPTALTRTIPRPNCQSRMAAIRTSSSTLRTRRLIFAVLQKKLMAHVGSRWLVQGWDIQTIITTTTTSTTTTTTTTTTITIATAAAPTALAPVNNKA